MKWLSCFRVLLTFMTLCMCEAIDYLKEQDICRQQYYSCESGPNVFCSCDSMCIYRDNCCYNAAVITEGRREMTYTQRKFLQLTTCVVTSFKEDDILTQGAFMISSCPLTWNGDIDTRKGCEMSSETNIRDMLPVVDTNTNLTFKNRQCAKCHNVQTFIPWLLKTRCSAERNVPSLSIVKDVMTKVNSDQCSYRFIPPKDVIVHYCYMEFNYTIKSDVSELDDNSNCSNRVFSPVYIDHGHSKNISYFRNLQCLIAAKGPRYQDYLKVSLCISTILNLHSTSETVLSSLIDFSLVIQRRTTKCKDEEIHLSDETGCRRLYCPVRFEPSAGECVDVKYTSDGVVLDLLFQVHPYSLSERKLLLIIHRIISSFLSNIRLQTGLTIVTDWMFLKTRQDIPHGILTNSTGKCYIIDIYIDLEASIDHTLKSERLWTANYFSNYTFINTDGSIVSHISNTQDISCQTNVSFHNPLFLKELVSVDNDLPCPAVKLQHSESESEIEGNIANTPSLLFNLNGINISSSDTVFANGDHYLCVDTFLSKYATFRTYDAFGSYRSYINIACASISIICMLFCLVQYCVIPIFRDGKSDLLVGHLLTLLLAQTCFLLLSNLAVRDQVCEWVGIFHHFTWLCAFSFMFLGPYRLNSEIRDLQTYSKTERLFITIKYLLVGISFPSFVVICIKVVNLFLAPTEKWYGGRLCFISQPYIVLFGFVVPILLILCGNVVLFICIIRYITSTSNSAHSNKSNLLVFIKISTIMGFSWIIGIVGILSQSDLVILVFEVLSNLQGAFITISFSCNNRVWTFYKDWLQRLKNNSRTENVPI